MPLYALTGPPQSPEANLSPTGSFLSLNATNLVLSTMKKSEDNDAVVLRLYEDAGDSAAGSVTLPTNVLHAVETNLLEEGGQSIPSSGAQCTVRMPQHAIRTYKISPKW
jgi:alpha-mannosidase